MGVESKFNSMRTTERETISEGEETKIRTSQRKQSYF